MEWRGSAEKTRGLAPKKEKRVWIQPGAVPKKGNQAAIGIATLQRPHSPRVHAWCSLAFGDTEGQGTEGRGHEDCRNAGGAL